MEKDKQILDSIDTKRNPFDVPEGYFFDFQKNIENKINDLHPKTKTAAKEISLFKKIKPWMYIAASFLVFGFCIQWYIAKMVQLEPNFANNTEVIENEYNEESVILYSYLDDLSIIDYLISDYDE